MVDFWQDTLSRSIKNVNAYLLTQQLHFQELFLQRRSHIYNYMTAL